MEKEYQGSGEGVKSLYGATTPEIENISKTMEEMADAPKEEYGKRQPGERGMYEIQRTIRNDEERISR